MSNIKEIRKATGLSQYKLAEWLGISRSFLNLAERGKRNLPQKLDMKLTAMNLLLLQNKETAMAGKTSETVFTEPAKLATRHKEKMQFHQRSALGLQIQLGKLKKLHPQINSRLTLLDAMKNHNNDLYIPTGQDKTWIEMMEWFSNEQAPAASLEEQELLRDKIETHLEYAELHKKRWERFSNM